MNDIDLRRFNQMDLRIRQLESEVFNLTNDLWHRQQQLETAQGMAIVLEQEIAACPDHAHHSEWVWHE